MTCEILSVGTELLLGQIVNTDAQFLSRRLSTLGINVYRIVTVGDNPERVREAVLQALSRSDMVITTGGLGPTEDDLTKEMVAEVFGLPLKLHEPSLDVIRSYFTASGRAMSENNVKQAYIPEGAIVMPNRKGTAPGCIIEKDGKRAAVLPGPPFELTDMYERQLEPYLLSLSDKKICSKFLKIVGVGESEVETRLLDLFHVGVPTLALYCSPGEVQARITVFVDKDSDPTPLLAPMEAEIRRRMGDAVYGEGLDMSMPKAVCALLAERGETLALAESCTGGMLASEIVDIPGASRVFEHGYVTYSNEAKVRTLGVSAATLAEVGAVSERVALEMAEGARRAASADWALSVTGVAGPDGGTPEHPVGLVYIGIAGKSGSRALRLELRGDRARIRSAACLRALNFLRLELIKK